MELKEDIKKLLFDFCESAEIDGYSEQVIRKSSIDYAVEQILTLLQSNDAGQPNGSKPIVSGALPLTENEYLKNKVKELLLFVESDGWVVNGFRTLEIVQELKKLCGNDR